MHNGIYGTLEEVVDHYDRGGDVAGNLSPNIAPLGLSAQEKADLVSFMKSLTGKQMVVTLPQLPN
jgi:cytochrome c peroxidase